MTKKQFRQMYGKIRQERLEHTDKAIARFTEYLDEEEERANLEETPRVFTLPPEEKASGEPSTSNPQRRRARIFSNLIESPDAEEPPKAEEAPEPTAPRPEEEEMHLLDRKLRQD
jgi:hypothetical protein